MLAEVAAFHSQHPGRTLGPDQLDVIVKVMPDQALEHRPDQLSMATQHRLTYRRVQHQGNKRSGVGIHAKDLVGLDRRPRRRASGSTVCRQRTAGLLRIRVIG